MSIQNYQKDIYINNHRIYMKVLIIMNKIYSKNGIYDNIRNKKVKNKHGQDYVFIQVLKMINKEENTVDIQVIKVHGNDKNASYLIEDEDIIQIVDLINYVKIQKENLYVL